MLTRYKKVGLETSSLCQLKCHSCPRASGATEPVIGNGYLRLNDITKLLDDNQGIKELELSNYGEIFTNPDLSDIIEEGFKRNVALTADNGVNLNTVSDEVLEGLVKFRFRSITISIDGASNHTYGLYRHGGNYETVINNVIRLNSYKEQYRSKYPLLTWQFVVFGHNEHELTAARTLAHEMHMRFYAKLSWDGVFSPVRNREAIRRVLGAASRAEYKERYGVDYSRGICNQLWEQPQINWDGKVLGCCRNFWGDFGGNAFTDGLARSLNSEKMQYARAMLTGRQGFRDDIPCASCQIYLDMKANGTWLKRGFRRWVVSVISPATRRAVKNLSNEDGRFRLMKVFHS